jgi:hypothetical protein
MPARAMGLGFGDLDNDGWLDIYITTGDPDYLKLMPNIMLRNDRGQQFQDVTFSGGFGHLQKGHGVAFGDLDNDGHQDIYHQQGGAYPGDKFQNAFYHNPGHPGNFLYVHLQGVQSNRAGVGVRVKAVIVEDGVTREIHRAAGAYSSFGSNPARLELGIGTAERVERLEVWWPKSNTRSIYHDIGANTQIRIIEGAGHPEALPLRRLTFKRMPSPALQATTREQNAPSAP